ncbi:MAG: ATP-binding cassette domain-containing protein [Candidatus Omnitrophota bacterium]
MIKADIKKDLMTARGPMTLKVNFEVNEGDLASFFGESGAGKTTILRIISGLADPDQGKIEVNNEIWFDSDKGINLGPQKRQVGFVFQNYSLFGHMTVRQNLEFALSDQKKRGPVDELLEIVHLKELQNQKPHQLSGGQQQRVALARAVLRKPKIFLLDEPFSCLDMDMRLKLQDSILNIYKRFKITTIFVSHSLPEIFKMSSKVFILENGEIKKQGIPAEVFLENHLSGKFKFTGEIIDIQKEEFLNIVLVSVGNHLIRVVATDEEMQGLRINDRIIVASKAFNPIILKLNS